MIGDFYNETFLGFEPSADFIASLSFFTDSYMSFSLLFDYN